jgi:choice-of-anchor B domain-containing protein
VYVFQYDMDASEWSLQTRLTPFDSRPNTLFGTSIMFDGTTTLIGAPGDNNRLGAFYAFGKDASGNWSTAQKMTSGILEGRAGFASTAAIGETVSIIGASGVDGRAGAAVVFERNASGGWDERNMVVNERRGFPAVTGGEVVCENDQAAAFECSDVNIVSFLPVKDIGGGRGTSINDVWGWTDPQSGSEYAIVGRTEGTSFVDVTDPYNPVYLGDLPMTEGSRPSIWRDMKVYRDHVYIVADNAGEHGVQVFNLTQLRTVRNAPVTFSETYLYDGIHSAHNIVINEETGYAYAVGTSGGGETCGGGLHMINIQDPGAPTFAGCFADPTTGRRLTGYVHDAQCVVYHGPDTEHEGKEICMGSNETALSISDVTDKDNPVALAMITYPNVAYAHQGWFSEDQRYFYMNDEGDEPQGLVEGTRTLVWDVVDLDDPVLVKEYIAETTTTDHNLYIRGDLMYQSNYGSGLRVLDISERENPVEIGFFDTTPYGGGGSWSNYPYFPSGVIIATSMSDGLFVLKATKQPRLTP